jgi:hypothetical protein
MQKIICYIEPADYGYSAWMIDDPYTGNPVSGHGKTVEEAIGLAMLDMYSCHKQGAVELDMPYIQNIIWASPFGEAKSHDY